MTDLTIDELIPRWERWLRGQKHQPRGVEKYRRTMEQVARWLGPQSALGALDERAVRRYREDQADDDKSASTIGSHLSCIRSFCRWSMEEELRTDDPTWRQRWPKKEETDPEALNADQLDALLIAIARPREVDEAGIWYWQRNRRAILSMLYTGARIAEQAALCWKAVHLRERRIVLTGKGGKQRSIPIHPRLLAELLKVPSVDRMAKKAVCGKREDGLPLTYKSFANIFDVWLPRYGIEIHAHQLRHTFASQLLLGGANLEEIRQLMGHAKLNTTQRYLRLDERDRRAAIAVLPDFMPE